MIMRLDPHKITEIVRLVRKRYPDWENFDHAQFREEEITYKQQAADAARETLSENNLRKGIYLRFVTVASNLAITLKLLSKQRPSCSPKPMASYQSQAPIFACCR